MKIRLDVEEFVRDYCLGIKDKDMLTKHKLSPRDFLVVIRNLMGRGLLTKQDYFDRNARIEELEARQEKEFIKSLYHCPVCSHIHPEPFKVCPACGVEIVQTSNNPSDSSRSFQFTLNDESESSEAPADTVETILDGETKNQDSSATDVSENHLPPTVTESKVMRALQENPPSSDVSAPEELFRNIGMELKNIMAPDTDLSAYDYHVVELTNSGHKASIFKAEDVTASGSDLAVKLFRKNVVPEGAFSEFVSEVKTVQMFMNDVNILSPIGSCVLDDTEALIYGYYPKTLERLLHEYPNGLPLELIDKILPQILNALGYSHMHRGTDGVIRRLAHMNIKLSKFSISGDNDVVKLEDCGVWTAMDKAHARKAYLWEEPGAEPAALAPESFVHESKYLNFFYVDIYALGAALYRVTTGKSPFTGSDIKEYSFLSLRTFPVPPRVHRWDIPAWLDAMILKCLNKEPQKRWRSATQMELAIGKGLQ